MPYIRIPGVKGKVFVPEECPAAEKKHTCPDCYVCQWCSDGRCTTCLNQKRCTGKKRRVSSIE